jgi:hypothetical protein
MSWKISLGAVVLVALSVLVTSTAISQEGPEQPSPEEMAKMMEMWKELGTPGPEHEFLGKWVGKWEIETRMWMAGPDAPPSVTKGKAEYRAVFGGRFLIQEMESQFMGMPLKGMGFTGYDKFRKVFFGTWFDSMSTTMYSFRGNLNREGNVLTMYGQMDEPALGVIGRFVRYETKVVSDDELVFTVYDLHAGEDYVAFQIHYTRAE